MISRFKTEDQLFSQTIPHDIRGMDIPKDHYGAEGIQETWLSNYDRPEL